MNDIRLTDLMRETTQNLPHRDLVPAALTSARRVRRSRRVTGVIAVAALVAVGAVVPTVLPHGRSQLRAPAGQPAKVFAAPALSASIIQRALDPAQVGSLPTGSLGLPADLTPTAAVATPPGRALMVTKERRGDQRVFYALDTDHRWHRLTVDAPADIGNGLGPMLDRTSLSPDGTEVALRGARATYVVDLGTGRTTSRPSKGGTHIAWQGQHRLRLDGAGDETYDGNTLIRLKDGFTETRDGAPAVRARLSAAKSYPAEDPTAIHGRLAVTADPSFSGVRHRPGTGLLVLARPSYEGLAFLPVGGPHDLTLADGSLSPRAWVGNDTLLFSIAPPVDHGGTVSMPREYYLSWNVRNGTVHRESATNQYWRDSSWATGLLR
ncbi:hypothetical protein [Nocardioides terrisoli]|uniref:hypothetical protein n=1 Tax=Nocardioides terrisoli TaxID=3388267 RepID=UPI00287BB4DC|nr:hypothetical protein [Nocardioides marmorisolisilvae]